MYKNIWLGSNELVIIFKNGKHRVIESYEDYRIVFTGTFDECVKYCKKRELDYLEAIIG